MNKSLALVTITTLLTSLTGCYNTYQVPSVEFRKLQSRQALAQDRKLKLSEEEGKKLLARAENDAVAVKTLKSKQVAVTRDTKIFVRSQGGRRYQITPFNFSMYSSQLVASDRDTLIPLSNLKAYEVDLLSNAKTGLLIGAGVAIAAGFIAVIATTSGTKSFN